MHAAILVHMIISILVFPIPNAAGSLVTIDSNDDVARACKQQVDHESRELFASFRVFCNRKSVSCNATPFSMLSFNNRFKGRNTANISLFSFLSPTKYYLQQVQCKEVLLEDTDIAKALIECVSAHSVELLVLGAPSRSGIVR